MTLRTDMSAYGPSPARRGPLLPPTRVVLPPRVDDHDDKADTSLTPALSRPSLTIYHLTSETAPPALAARLYAEFQAELDRGATYPQEHPMSRTAFDAYFLAHDFFVAVLLLRDHHGGGGADRRQGLHLETRPDADDGAQATTVEHARAGRQWVDCLGGAFYVKPNYPGRSSHICNAGFLVPPRYRSLGIATALARAYVDYAPRLGYKASVFNLVYVNNVASIRIWDKLGFEKVGRIPGAGRLKRRPEEGGGEEYVDAWVVYKSFEAGV